MRREHIVNQIRDIVHRVAPTAQTILYGKTGGDWDSAPEEAGTLLMRQS